MSCLSGSGEIAAAAPAVRQVHLVAAAPSGSKDVASMELGASIHSRSRVTTSDSPGLLSRPPDRPPHSPDSPESSPPSLSQDIAQRSRTRSNPMPSATAPASGAGSTGRAPLNDPLPLPLARGRGGRNGCSSSPSNAAGRAAVSCPERGVCSTSFESANFRPHLREKVTARPRP